MKKILRRVLIIMLIFTLIYSNGILTINAVVNSITIRAAEVGENEELEEANETENQEETQTEIGSKAELGLNVNELSTTLENDVQFTITLFTNSNTYDLFKNPEFLIELPSCIQTINTIRTEDIAILNNKTINEQGNEEDIFTNLEIEQFEETEKKYIQITLTGEQKEYLESQINNVQIVIPVKMKTPDLLPTLDEEIVLYYLNENKTSYITESTKKIGYGEFTKNVKFIAATGILTETNIIVGETGIRNLNGESNVLSISSTLNSEGTVKITVVNNTGEDLNNINILGNSELLQNILVEEGVVKYSEKDNIDLNDEEWSSVYTENSKSYLIELESLPQGESVEYQYNISIPTANNDTTYEEKYKVLTNNNVELTEQTNIIEVKTFNNEIETDTMKINLYATVEKNSSSMEQVEIGSVLEYGISLMNKDSIAKNITVIGKLPENIDAESISGSILAEDEETECWIPEEDPEISISNNEITIIVSLEPNKEKYVNIAAVVDKYISTELETVVEVKYDEEDYILRDIQHAITPANIIIESAAYKNNIKITEENIELSEEDELLYEIKVKNIGETSEQIEISSEISNFLDVKSIKYISEENNIEWEEENLSNNFGISGENLGENEEGILTVVAMLPEKLDKTSDLISAFKIGGNYMEASNITIKHHVEVEQVNPEEPEEPVNPDNPQNPEEPTIPDETQYYTISGLAWLDKNENGARDSLEPVLSNIGVKLVKDDETVKETLTDNTGKYIFQDISKGDYAIIFSYDSNMYKLTTPKQIGVAEEINSDAYEVNIDGENVVRTDKLSITNNLDNIDIGLIERGTFDLKLEKKINKITISNNEGTKVVNYKNEDFVKIEIPAKNYVGTNLIIEYNIIIENIGDVAGYVYSLADLIPEGTEFISELNQDWYEENGILYSVSLSGEKINPQERIELTVILTKELEDDEAVTIKNKAEILETFNEELLQEKDLNNNISEAQVIVSVKTGNTETYILLGITILTIIATGAYIIKKKVLA